MVWSDASSRENAVEKKGETYQDGDTNWPSYKGPEQPGLYMGKPA